MKTVIVTCDRCQVVINQTDVLTGFKYIPSYMKYELNCGGSLKEFCGMHCMELQIHTGEKTNNKEGLDMNLINEPPMPTKVAPTFGSGMTVGGNPVGYPG